MNQLKKTPLKLIISILFLLLLTGCATAPAFNVKVDSISSPLSAQKSKYVLLPGVEGVNADDLQYLEYAAYIERALSVKGFVKVENSHDAEIAIFFVYGIGDPETSEYTYSVPTWGQTGVSSANTYGTVNSYGNTATYSGTTTYTPTYGVTGSNTYSGSVTNYFRYMFLDAIDLNEYRKTKKEKQIWKTTVTSTGSTGDLRRVLPILVAASKEYISTNTGKKISVQIQESDKKVKEIKGLPLK